MTPYIYHKTENKIVEKATMPEPVLHRDAISSYKDEMHEYLQHIASLKQFDCRPSCKDAWSDGEDVTGKYELKKEFNHNAKNFITTNGHDDWSTLVPVHHKQYPERLCAYPLTTQESEDEFNKFLDTEKTLGLSDKKTIERVEWYYNTYFKSPNYLLTKNKSNMTYTESKTLPLNVNDEVVTHDEEELGHPKTDVIGIVTEIGDETFIVQWEDLKDPTEYEWQKVDISGNRIFDPKRNTLIRKQPQ